MLRLSAQCKPVGSGAPFVARVTTGSSPTERTVHLAIGPDSPDGFPYYLRIANPDQPVAVSNNTIDLPPEMAYLAHGDIIYYDPRSGRLTVLYRKSARFNAILTTERCNSNCLMCSQPPKTANDDHLMTAYLRAIPLMAKETPELGITGGEPTLLGDRLLELIGACRDCLPSTSLHMLSNGRLMTYMSLCRQLAELKHPDFMVGIPIYSDLARIHDFVVQARGAFDQTIRGIMNLARWGVPMEIRVVLHQQTIPRLAQLARFLARNLPFVDQVSLMGLEMTGHVKANLGALWIDPFDYQDSLKAAVETLVNADMKVLIFNHQLCVLDKSLWPFAVKSISDWKNEYLPACDRCQVRSNCGGFFASANLRRSDHIHPIVVDCKKA